MPCLRWRRQLWLRQEATLRRQSSTRAASSRRTRSSPSLSRARTSTLRHIDFGFGLCSTAPAPSSLVESHAPMHAHVAKCKIVDGSLALLEMLASSTCVPWHSHLRGISFFSRVHALFLDSFTFRSPLSTRSCFCVCCDCSPVPRLIIVRGGGGWMAGPSFSSLSQRHETSVMEAERCTCGHYPLGFQSQRTLLSHTPSPTVCAGSILPPPACLCSSRIHRTIVLRPNYLTAPRNVEANCMRCTASPWPRRQAWLLGQAAQGR